MTWAGVVSVLTPGVRMAEREGRRGLAGCCWAEAVRARREKRGEGNGLAQISGRLQRGPVLSLVAGRGGRSSGTPAEPRRACSRRIAAKKNQERVRDVRLDVENKGENERGRGFVVHREKEDHGGGCTNSGEQFLEPCGTKRRRRGGKWRRGSGGFIAARKARNRSHYGRNQEGDRGGLLPFCEREIFGVRRTTMTSCWRWLR